MSLTTLTLPVPSNRGQCRPLTFVYVLPDRSRKGSGTKEEEDPAGPAMAATDNGATPLQNAMKMAKVAIQLDGGSEHKVVGLHRGPVTAVRRSKPTEKHAVGDVVELAAVMSAGCCEPERTCQGHGGGCTHLI